MTASAPDTDTVSDGGIDEAKVPIVSARVMARMQQLLNELVAEDHFGDEEYAPLEAVLVAYMEAYERVYSAFPDASLEALESFKREESDIDAAIARAATEKRDGA